jgi:hypothetical protein
MASGKDKEKKRQETMESLLRQLQQLVFNSYILTFTLPSVKNAIKNGNDNFFFANNDTANKEVNKLLIDMAKQMDYLLLNGIQKEWKQGEENFWNNLKLTFSKTDREHKAFDQIRNTATQAARNQTAQAFYNEKRDGFNISNRVWNLAGNAKKEIEIILQNSIKEGKNAKEIQKSVKGYLNEPDKLFKRVRNKETGDLEWSKATQRYKPGRGVYRSAYANAMRLARTEIKAAYCEAVWNAAQHNPLITGWRIVLSNNHTTLIKGKKIPLKDICDELQGIYPKSFKFRGWHPQCRCEMLPVIITQEESKDLYKSTFDSKRDEWKPKEITKVPEVFTNWIQKNQERAKGWANMPRFIKDNSSFVFSKNTGYFTTYTSTSEKVTPTEILDLSNIHANLSKLAKQHPEYFSNGYAGIFPAPPNQSYLASTDIGMGKIFVNFAKNEYGFDAGTSLLGAFDKIKQGIVLTEHEEYAMEVLWHEILHLKSKNTVILPRIDDPNGGFQRAALETTNQFVARKTYDKFMKQLGGNPIHQKWILENGYGYKETVNNTRELLRILDINEDDFCKRAEELLMKNYSAFDKKIVNLMEKMSRRKNLMDIYGRIEIEDFALILKIFNKGR